MNVLSLFAGIGGLDLGLERAGMTVVGQVEIDPFCQRVLAKHWPEVPRHDDVRTAVQWWLGAARPAVDVVAGGYPCQPESTAGRRRGTDDERWLWPDMARVVHAVRPRWVIGENVMGHRTRGLRFVLRDLDRLGYATSAGIVSAAEMGAPHRRQRIFVLAADPERVDLRVEPRWGGGTGGEGSALAGVHGAAEPVAHADGEARRPEARAALAGAGAAPLGIGAQEPGGRRPPLADANSAREQKAPGERWELGSGSGVRSPELADADERSTNWAAVARPECDHWAAEPDVGRVAHGVPGRVDRLRALGNAVVPQVAEHIGRLVMAGAS